jgi:hypothetical protein
LTAWSPGQAAALDKIGRWLRDGRPQVFRLFGYAGTGKTTLAKHITAGLGGRGVFVAPTGKAAAVMRDNGCHGAMTVHRAIYGAPDVREDGSLLFSPKKRSALDGAALVVLDESSMVDEELARDLLAHGVPVLAMGDPAQLPPPVGGCSPFTSKTPDVMLTEIHPKRRAVRSSGCQRPFAKATGPRSATSAT